MSAETLRRAAALMREGNTSDFGGHEDRFMLAVADWLDSIAAAMDLHATEGAGVLVAGQTSALAVARAYLGEAS